MASLGFTLEPQQSQPCSTATECSQLAYLADVEHHRIFRQFLERHLAAHPEDRNAVHYVPGPVKTPASIAGKIDRMKVTNPASDFRSVPDYVRSRIVVDNPEALSRVVNSLHNERIRFSSAADFISSPYRDGFRAMNLKLILPKSGFTSELQIIPASSIIVASVSHANYEELRTMPPLSDQTATQQARFNQLTAESRVLEDLAASQHGFSSMLNSEKAPLHDTQHPDYAANFMRRYPGQEAMLAKYLDPAFKLPPAPQPKLASRVTSAAEAGLARAERLYDKVGQATGSRQAVERANQALNAATLGLSDKTGTALRKGATGIIAKAAPFLHKVGLLQLVSFAGRALPIAGAAVGAAHGLWETGRHIYEGDFGKASAALAGGAARTFFGLGGAAGLAYGEASYESIRQGLGRIGDQMGRDWWVSPSLPVAVGQMIRVSVSPAQVPKEQPKSRERAIITKPTSSYARFASTPEASHSLATPMAVQKPGERSAPPARTASPATSVARARIQVATVPQ